MTAFEDDQESIENDPKSGSLNMLSISNKMRQIWNNNLNVTSRMMVKELRVSKDFVHMILRNYLSKR